MPSLENLILPSNCSFLTVARWLFPLFCVFAVLQSVSNGLHYQGAMSTDYNEYAELKNTASR
jgi:hypothetical protein